MAKLIKKKDCKFDHGYIVRKNKIVGLPWNVWCQLNKLETMIQQWEFLKVQDEYRPGPSLDGFERRSAFGNNRPYSEKPDTPTIDRRVNEALEFMAEADMVEHTNQINEAIDDFGALVDWCESNKFVEGDCINKIDLAELGNPLKLKAKDVAEILRMMTFFPCIIEE